MEHVRQTDNQSISTDQLHARMRRTHLKHVVLEGRKLGQRGERLQREGHRVASKVREREGLKHRRAPRVRRRWVDAHHLCLGAGSELIVLRLGFARLPPVAGGLDLVRQVYTPADDNKRFE